MQAVDDTDVAGDVVLARGERSDAERHHGGERVVGLVALRRLGTHLDVDLGHLVARVEDDDALTHLRDAPAVREEPHRRGGRAPPRRT